MTIAASCPEAALLQQFALGRLSAADIETLAAHVENCDRCARRLEALPARDTLIEAMSAQATAVNEPLSNVVNGLIERLRALPPAAPNEDGANAGTLPTDQGTTLV
jgi:hypothetical protein